MGDLAEQLFSRVENMTGVYSLNDSPYGLGNISSVVDELLLTRSAISRRVVPARRKKKWKDREKREIKGQTKRHSSPCFMHHFALRSRYVIPVLLPPFTMCRWTQTVDTLRSHQTRGNSDLSIWRVICEDHRVQVGRRSLTTVKIPC